MQSVKMEHVKDMMEYSCVRCTKELTDEEYKIKKAKKDNASIYTPVGLLFYMPSYIFCTECKRKLLTVDIVVSFILIMCMVALFFIC